MKTVMNVSKNTKTINLNGKKSSLYLPRRAKAQLTEQEFGSPDVQALIRNGYLRVLGGDS